MLFLWKLWNGGGNKGMQGNDVVGEKSFARGHFLTGARILSSEFGSQRMFSKARHCGTEIM